MRAFRHTRRPALVAQGIENTGKTPGIPGDLPAKFDAERRSPPVRPEVDDFQFPYCIHDGIFQRGERLVFDRETFDRLHLGTVEGHRIGALPRFEKDGEEYRILVLSRQIQACHHLPFHRIPGDSRPDPVCRRIEYLFE